MNILSVKDEDTIMMNKTLETAESNAQVNANNIRRERATGFYSALTQMVLKQKKQRASNSK